MNAELIEGPFLIRPYRPGDVDAVYEAVRESIAEVSPWLPWCHPEYKREQTVAFILSGEEAWQSGGEYSFGVFEKESDHFLGGVGLNQFNHIHRIGNLGYWVRTRAIGRGIASTAARRIAQFGFEQLALQRIEIVAALTNIASQRVAEKAGAIREGVQRQRILIRGEAQDAVVYSLVRDDLTILSR
jgi:ribosomal-protein-serine acetyltransferase